MAEHLSGRRKRSQIRLVAQCAPEPVTACAGFDERQTQRRAERFKPVIHSDQQIPLPQAYRLNWKSVPIGFP
jgi:hypothetical protein